MKSIKYYLMKVVCHFRVSVGITDNDRALAKVACRPLDLCRNLSATFANAMLLAGGIFSNKLKLKY